MRSLILFFYFPATMSAFAQEIQADTTKLYNDVHYLSELRPARSHAHRTSLEKAASYISDEFRKVGADPQDQLWEVGGHTYRNVIATYNPQGDRTLVVGAHYDVAGDQPGADDNASGVAGLLELARMLFTQRPQLEYRIEMVAYCLEEPPYFGTKDMGSYIHAKSLHDARSEVIGMLSLEMIGYFSDEPGSQPFPDPELAKLYPHTANFIIVVGVEEHAAFARTVHQLMKQDATIDTRIIIFPDSSGLAGLSDQRNYWPFGFPALMINDTAFIRNQNYHTREDTIDTLDFPKMAAVVEGVYRAVVDM